MMRSALILLAVLAMPSSAGVMQMLMAGSPDRAYLPATFEALALNFTASTATATLSLNNNGSATSTGTPTDAGSTGTFTWRTGPHASSGYEVYLTGTGDTLTGPSTNTWLDLSTSRVWSLSRTTEPGESAWFGTISIRSATTQIVLATASVAIMATVAP